MYRLRIILHSGLWAAVAIFVCCGRAYAYIDPGTGSYILQIVIAGLVGAALTLKLFWRRLRLFMSNVASKMKNRREERPPGEDE
jgi:hypothetical protein